LTHISIIAAIDINGLIGKSNHLPWSIKEDLAHFRETTMGHPVVMGWNTWKSIGKPLDGRTNVVLTHNNSIQFPGIIIVNSIEQVIEDFSSEEIFIIGGASVFQQFLPYADKMYLSRINHTFEGDTYFPEVDWSKWELQYYEQINTSAGYQINCERWENKSPIEFPLTSRTV
jgi:dihydrofolate reductase